jgi:hypothetical protein
VRIIPYSGDSPPIGFPQVLRNGNGDVTFIWLSSYTDDYGIYGAVNIVGAVVGICGIVAQPHAYQLLDNDANGLNESVRVRIFQTDGTAAASPQFTLSVVTGT